MDEISEQREQRINALVKEMLKEFEEFRGKDISRLSIINRDKYIEGRVASDLEISDDLFIQLRALLRLYEAHIKRETNTAALLFLINGIKGDETRIVDVVAKIENKEK